MAFAVGECVHYIVDLLRIYDSFAAPVLENLYRIYFGQKHSSILIARVKNGLTCFVLVRFGRPCFPSGTTLSTIICKSRETKST